MANPQLEGGYTRIANEILAHLMRIQLSANQWQVLLCIIRKTYGFGRKVDRIANFQICEATGLGKEVVSRSLHKLQAARIIVRNGTQIGFQKDWEQWPKFAEQSNMKISRTANKELAKTSTELIEQLTIVSSPDATQKKKETIQNTPDKENIDNCLLSEELKRVWGH
jgi:phage replication O-like protein O